MTNRPTILTDDQIAAFRRDGFVVLPQLLSADEITHIRDTYTNLAADGPVPGLSDMGAVEKCRPDEPLAKWPRLMHPHRHTGTEYGDLAMRTMLDARVRASLSDIMDDEPLAAQTMFYFKPAGARGQDLHQDNFYLRVAPGTCYAAWIAVDDADPENGGMVVVPESGDMAIVCPDSNGGDARFFTNVHVPVPQGKKEVDVTMKAGDVLFFNGSLIHGSYPNESKTRFRRAFISHYLPKSSAELSQYYDTYTFDGEKTPIAPAQGGGACGDPNVTAAAPH